MLTPAVISYKNLVTYIGDGTTHKNVSQTKRVKDPPSIIYVTQSLAKLFCNPPASKVSRGVY